jgi:aspartate 1-decarboxylase
MRRTMFLGKIHRAVITHADLHYEGSVTIDTDLMDAAGILQHEQIHVWNITRGTRSGVICINGAAAHGNQPGDLVILATFAEMGEDEARLHRPKVVRVDDRNRIIGMHAEIPGPQMPRAFDEIGSA